MGRDKSDSKAKASPYMHLHHLLVEILGQPPSFPHLGRRVAFTGISHVVSCDSKREKKEKKRKKRRSLKKDLPVL